MLSNQEAPLYPLPSSSISVLNSSVSVAKLPCIRIELPPIRTELLTFCSIFFEYAEYPALAIGQFKHAIFLFRAMQHLLVKVVNSRVHLSPCCAHWRTYETDHVQNLPPR